jgi:hypothetical protein
MISESFFKILYHFLNDYYLKTHIFGNGDLILTGNPD